MGWDEDDPDEPIIDGIIDIGEVAAERLGLEINPFPRAPDAEFNGYTSSEGPRTGGIRHHQAVCRAQKHARPQKLTLGQFCG